MKELSDLTTPAAIAVKPMLEAEVQSKCVAWMRGRGYWCRKFSSQSQRSVPDYLFAKTWVAEEHWCVVDDPVHIKFGTEFKREDCKPKWVARYAVSVMSTEAQYEEQLAMQAAGWYTFECNNVELFKQTVLEYEGSQLC